MIPFRYHVVSLVAVLLALAAGVALGGGPLSDLGRTAKADPASEASSDPGAAAAAASYADALASAGAIRLYADGLKGATVMILAFPGSSAQQRSSLAAQIEAAGGTVASTINVQPALVDPGEKTLVDTLGAQLMTQLPAGTVSADASTYSRIGELLGAALTTPDASGNKAVGDQSSSIRAGLDGAELVTESGEATGRATYVVALLGSDDDPATDPIYSGLLAGLTGHAVGVVAAADDPDGVLSRLRESSVAPELATVDHVDGAAGQVTAVLALTQWPATKGGSFGASGADGAVGLR